MSISYVFSLLTAQVAYFQPRQKLSKYEHRNIQNKILIIKMKHNNVNFFIIFFICVVYYTYVKNNLYIEFSYCRLRETHVIVIILSWNLYY